MTTIVRSTKSKLEDLRQPAIKFGKEASRAIAIGVITTVGVAMLAKPILEALNGDNVQLVRIVE